MVDIFAGLGGASSAFVDHPDWEVIRVESNIIPLDYHRQNDNDFIDNLSTYIYGDITKWETFDKLVKKIRGRPIDLLWMSPPCTEFSNARQPKVENPDLSLLYTSIALKESLSPRYWIIENVKGAIKKFDEIVGHNAFKSDPFYLWGSFPMFSCDIKHSKVEGDTWSDDPLRPFNRAKVPLEYSEALRKSVQYQHSLDLFFKKG